MVCLSSNATLTRNLLTQKPYGLMWLGAVHPDLLEKQLQPNTYQPQQA
jgi:hypothetical protein